MFAARIENGVIRVRKGGKTNKRVGKGTNDPQKDRNSPGWVAQFVRASS